MAQGERPLRTERGLDRLVNFSDATVAIAMTLLVLPLVDLATRLDGADLFGFLGEHVGELVAFVVTFVVTARFWLVHHHVFEWLVDYSPALIRWNFVWLFGIVAVPFSANLLTYDDATDPGVSGFYIATLLWIALAMLGIERYLRRSPGLLRDDGGAGFDLEPSYVFVGLLVVALLVGVLVPHVGIWALLILVLSGPVEAVVRRLRRR
ncbi:TMEM175 family protein [Agromyces seonyuensis]|uniref:DUF1211 domain-containing protein n=1 Tax=Agromyces seonyuensis TaxID=2662446 RepID=A0A6I4NTG8_9MICO|nr:TMEM175 family protein [Agromyces seonyuensis]MWB97756.1 DUF1211 domain-containing protein [Agromyces seonyuensis]